MQTVIKLQMLPLQNLICYFEDDRDLFPSLKNNCLCVIHKVKFGVKVKVKRLLPLKHAYSEIFFNRNGILGQFPLK